MHLLMALIHISQIGCFSATVSFSLSAHIQYDSHEKSDADNSRSIVRHHFCSAMDLLRLPSYQALPTPDFPVNCLTEIPQALSEIHGTEY